MTAMKTGCKGVADTIKAEQNQHHDQGSVLFETARLIQGRGPRIGLFLFIKKAVHSVLTFLINKKRSARMRPDAY